MPPISRAATALSSDLRRSLWALGMATVSPAVVTAWVARHDLAGLRDGELAEYYAIVIFVALTVFELVYCALTWWAFGRLDGAALDTALTGSVSPKPWVGRFLGGGAAAWSIEVSLMALVAAMALARGSIGTHAIGVVVLGLAMVCGAWATMQVSYALNYARIDRTVGGFRFVDNGPRHFWDYLYVAISIGTTFSTSDVEVTTTPMRRMVSGHAVLNFLFSAVIVALAVAILTR